MTTLTPWPCRFHSAATPGVTIVGCGCPLGVESRFHGRGTFGPPLSATFVGDAVPVLMSSTKGEAYQSPHSNADRDFDGLTVTIQSSRMERSCVDLAASHTGTLTSGERMVPFQLTTTINGLTSNQKSFPGGPKVHPKMAVQGQRRHALCGENEMQSFGQDSVLFHDEQLIRRDAATHPTVPPVDRNPADLALQPPLETVADRFSLQPSRQKPPPTPWITQLSDPDLDDVDESHFFLSSDKLDQKR